MGAAAAAGGLALAGCAAPEQSARPAARLELNHQGRGEASRGAAPQRAVAAPPDCGTAKCVALTFDDGPGPHTGRLLDQLGRAAAHATFFVLGQSIRGHEKVMRRMVADGHEVANHSWSHPDLADMSGAGVREEVRRTQEAIRRAAGIESRLFRPPYGSTNARVARAAGLPQILWSVDSLDWQHRSRARNASIGVRTPRRGDIVLYHDIHLSTVQAMPQVLTGLKRRGFRLVTVSELMRGKKLRPGGRYTHRAANPPKNSATAEKDAARSPEPC